MPTPDSHPLRALRSRDFRLYFAGQLVSVAGTWMQQIAMAWLAYRLTHSAFILGLLGFASQVPILLFGALGGVWSDRMDRRHLMLWTQSLSLLQALAMAVLIWRGWLTPPLLLGLAFALGCINALDVPARQSLVVHLVEERALLPNAIALTSFLMNATRFLGPALAGFVIAWLGELACFVMNAASYLAVLLALLAMRARPGGHAAKSALHELFAGARYTFNHPDIRGALVRVAGVSFLVMPYLVMLPAYAKGVFHGDSRTYGFLASSAGAGSMLASVFLATREDVAGLARAVALAAITAGLSLALFALNPIHVLAYPLLMLVGFSVVLTAAGSNTLLQGWVRDDMRGRVMATFSMAFLGIAPLGSLAVGSLATLLGLPTTLALCGVLTLALGWLRLERIPGKAIQGVSGD